MKATDSIPPLMVYNQTPSVSPKNASNVYLGKIHECFSGRTSVTLILLLRRIFRHIHSTVVTFITAFRPITYIFELYRRIID